MAETRKGEVTFKGNPVELAGPKLKPGDQAPDFTCVGAGLSLVKLADTAGKARLFNIVPSLDTPVCNKQTRKFSEELTALGDKVAWRTVTLGVRQGERVEVQSESPLQGEVVTLGQQLIGDGSAVSVPKRKPRAEASPAGTPAS